MTGKGGGVEGGGWGGGGVGGGGGGGGWGGGWFSVSPDPPRHEEKKIWMGGRVGLGEARSGSACSDASRQEAEANRADACGSLKLI